MLLEDPRNELFFSTISLWEITKLDELGRIDIKEGLQAFLEKLHSHPRYSIVELLPSVLIHVSRLAKTMHRDPADQIIVASAIAIEAHLMTNDKTIIKGKFVPII